MGEQIVDVVVFRASFLRGFQLKRNVADPELMEGNLPQAAAQGVEVALVIGIDEHVRGQRFVMRRDGPDVEIVDQGHAFHLFHLAAQAIHVNMFGGALDQHVDDLGQQTPGTGEDQDADTHADNGIGQCPPEGPDEECLK